MKQAALALSVLFLTAGSAHAQDAPAPREPQTVRVRLRSQETVQGYLRGRSKDEMVVFTSDGRYRHVALNDVQRLEVRSRTGSHLKRGALIGVLVWGSVMAAAALSSLDEAGVASWQSGAILGGSVGLGAVIGSQVPRYGWRVTEPRSVSRPALPPGVHLTLRF